MSLSKKGTRPFPATEFKKGRSASPETQFKKGVGRTDEEKRKFSIGIKEYWRKERETIISDNK